MSTSFVVTAREAARQHTGEFGLQGHSDPGLVPDSPATVMDALNRFDQERAGDMEADVWNEVIYDRWDETATSARWDDSNSDDFIGDDGVHYGFRQGRWQTLDDTFVAGDMPVNTLALELSMEPHELRALMSLPDGTELVPGELVDVAREVNADSLDPDDPDAWSALKHSRHV